MTRGDFDRSALTGEIALSFPPGSLAICASWSDGVGRVSLNGVEVVCDYAPSEVVCISRGGDRWLWFPRPARWSTEGCRR